MQTSSEVSEVDDAAIFGARRPILKHYEQCRWKTEHQQGCSMKSVEGQKEQ